MDADSSQDPSPNADHCLHSLNLLRPFYTVRSKFLQDNLNYTYYFGVCRNVAATPLATLEYPHGGACNETADPNDKVRNYAPAYQAPMFPRPFAKCYRLASDASAREQTHW